MGGSLARLVLLTCVVRLLLVLPVRRAQELEGPLRPLAEELRHPKKWDGVQGRACKDARWDKQDQHDMLHRFDRDGL